MPDRSTHSHSGLVRELRSNVLWLAFDRPRAANAIDRALSHAFADALATAASDDAVCAVVMTGAGDRIFSAGIDVKNPDGLDHETLSAQRRETVTRCLTAIIDFEKPLIAAVNGPAIGLGAMLTLLADHAIASDRAVFSLPEIDIGIPTFLGISIVARAAGAALARELALTGRRMDAAEAKTHGMISMVATAENLAAAAQAAAESLAAKPKTAFAFDKRWLARGLHEEFAAANAQSQAAQPRLAPDRSRRKP